MNKTIVALALAASSALAFSTPAQAAPGPVALWELNETSGRVMVDSGPNRINGKIGTRVVVGGGVYTFSGPTAPDDERLVLVRDNKWLDPGTDTYAVTVRFNTAVAGPNIVQKGQANVAGGFWKVVLAGGYPRCEFRDGAGRTLAADLVGTSTVNTSNDGLWHVVRCERSTTGVRVVLDPGTTAEAARLTPGTVGRIDNNRPLTIGGKVDCNGRKVGCDYFTGSIDYVRITRF